MLRVDALYSRNNLSEIMKDDYKALPYFLSESPFNGKNYIVWTTNYILRSVQKSRLKLLVLSTKICLGRYYHELSFSIIIEDIS